MAIVKVSGIIVRMIRLIKTLILIGIAFGIGYLFGNQEIRFYRIISSSMEPTLETGDRVITVKPVQLERKNIVALKTQENGEIIIKRIIGLPGETIKIKKGSVYINGEELKESYIKEKPSCTVTKKIPPSRYFVLGDNRNISEENSTLGPIDKEWIIGKVVLRYWPVKKFKIIFPK